MNHVLLAASIHLSIVMGAHAQTHPLPLIQPAQVPSSHVPHESSSATPFAGTAHSTTQTFQPIDRIDHQDNLWQNMLSGDADHDGLQEFVLRTAPVEGSTGNDAITFFEDDGAGNFHEVHSIPLAQSGLLALGDVDDDGLSDLFFERGIAECVHEFVRWESSSPDGFPDHETWSDTKEGNVIDFRGFIADTDGDGVKEFITADNNFTCLPTTLKIFESAPDDQMTLTWNALHGFFLGNPVVADFDLNGKPELVIAGLEGAIYDFEATGDDTYVLLSVTSHLMINAYQLALIDRYSPDGRPMLFLTGQPEYGDYRVQVYERTSAAPKSFSLLGDIQLPTAGGLAIPQICAADLFGSRTPELAVTRLGGPVAILTVGAQGALSLFDTPMLPLSEELVATTRTATRSGAIAVGIFPTAANPLASTVVLQLQ